MLKSVPTDSFRETYLTKSLAPCVTFDVIDCTCGYVCTLMCVCVCRMHVYMCVCLCVCARASFALWPCGSQTAAGMKIALITACEAPFQKCSPEETDVCRSNGTLSLMAYCCALYARTCVCVYIDRRLYANTDFSLIYISATCCFFCGLETD